MNKKAVLAWFAARDGKLVDTMQVRNDGGRWEPGARRVHVAGSHITLDGSRVTLDGRSHVVSGDGRAVVVVWRDDDDRVIHVTTYTDAR